MEARLADKFAEVLEKGSDRQRRVLLAGLTEFHLRRGDVYESRGPIAPSVRRPSITGSATISSRSSSSARVMTASRALCCRLIEFARSGA